MLTLNRFMCAGNLTKDPEAIVVPKGEVVTNLRLALNRKWKGAGGKWKEEVAFIGVEVWGKAGQSCAQHLVKGSGVFVEGRLASKESKARDGERNSYIVVVAERVQFLNAKNSAEAGEAVFGASIDSQD